MQIKTEALARQLTLIGYELLQDLTHEEFLEMRWRQQAQLCPNIRRFNNHFNYVRTHQRACRVVGTARRAAR